MILMKFTPGFTIKSLVAANEDLTIEIVGVNLKGYEIFKYEVLEDVNQQQDRQIFQNSLATSYQSLSQ